VKAVQHFPRLPVATLAAVILAVFFLFVLSFGLHVDSLGVYWAAGEAFKNGLNPYTYTARYDSQSQFKYSPLFALGMAFLSQVQPIVLSIALWTLLSITAFLVGLFRWVDWRATPTPLMPLVLLACFIDLGVCLWANQANALVIGLALVGLANYRDQRFFAAGFTLMLATNLKIYPGVFLFALCMLGNRRYWLGALICAVGSFLMPSLFVGLSADWTIHQSWLHLLMQEVHSNGILDLRSAFLRVGLVQLGQRLPWIIGLVSIPLFLLVRNLDLADWRPWITLGCSATLLISPKSEVFTYVLLAPCYVLMAMHCAESKYKPLRTAGLGCTLALAALIVSNRFIVGTWMMSEDSWQILRVLGALGFWLLSALILAHSYARRRASA
jgi:hypothetical protein